MSSAREIAERFLVTRSRGDDHTLASCYLAAEERIKELEQTLSNLNSDALVNHAHTADVMLHAALEREGKKDARIRALEEALAHALYRNHEFSNGCTPCCEARTLLAAEKREDERNG